MKNPGSQIDFVSIRINVDVDELELSVYALH